MNALLSSRNSHWKPGGCYTINKHSLARGACNEANRCKFGVPRNYGLHLQGTRVPVTTRKPLSRHHSSEPFRAEPAIWPHHIQTNKCDRLAVRKGSAWSAVSIVVHSASCCTLAAAQYTRYDRTRVRYIRTRVRCVRTRVRYDRTRVRYIRTRVRYVRTRVRYIRTRVRYIRTRVRYDRTRRTRVRYVRTRVRYIRTRV
eukprot:8643831-Pyramimonas_sp.AAC.1